MSLVDEGELGVTDAVVVVVCPTENTEYHNSVTSARLARVGTTVEGAEGALVEPRHFRMTTQARLLGSIAATHKGSLGTWLRYQTERYGW